MSELVERLRADDFLHNRGPNYEPLKIPASALRLEAATEITRLQEALAAAEARIAAKDEALSDARKWLNGPPERSTCKAATWSELIASIDAALTSDPLPAETRKKALEAAAAWHEQQHAALGSKPVWQMLSCHLEYAAAIRSLAEEVQP